MPTIGAVNGGLPLFYRRRVNGLTGESGSGKSMCAQDVVAKELIAGNDVVFVDLEDHADNVCSRILGMGVPEHIIVASFHYISPLGPANVLDLDAIDTLIEDTSPTLLVIDSTGEAMAVQGLNGGKDEEVSRWFGMLPRRAARRGPAVVVIDHVTKDPETRGLYAIGSQRKRAVIDGAAYMVERRKPMVIGGIGSSKIITAKDRNGNHANGSLAAVFTLDSTDGAILVASLDAPCEAAEGEPSQFRPTGLMEKVSRWIETNSAAGPPSKNAIETGVQGKRDYVRQAIATLIDEGFITTAKQGQATVHTIVNVYRETDDPLDETGQSKVQP